MELRTLLKRFSKKVGIDDLGESNKANEEPSSEFSRYEDYLKTEIETGDFSNFLHTEYKPILDEESFQNVLNKYKKILKKRKSCYHIR